jgi:hypothetical protein
MEKLKLGIWIGILTLILTLSRPMDSYAWVREQDSLILVELYNATNGNNWLHNENWLITQVRWWYGVTLWNDTTVQWIELPNNNMNGYISNLLCQLPFLWYIDFSGNSLSGEIPSCIGEMPVFRSLVLNDNHLSGQLPESLGLACDNGFFEILIRNNEFTGHFPDTIIKGDYLSILDIRGNKFSSIAHTNSTLFHAFYMENNCFTFEDIIPYKLDPPEDYFSYSPQDSVLTEIDTTLLVGSPLVMDAWVDTCSNNKYRWKKNGNFLNLAPSVNPQWVIPALQYSDSGYYTCDITNNLAGQLVLKRRLIKVHVTTDVGELEPKAREELQVSHDPKEDMLHIRMDFNSSENVSCNLYDVNGRKIMRCYEGTTQKQDFHYSLHSFPPGVYFLRNTTGDRAWVVKVVK